MEEADLDADLPTGPKEAKSTVPTVEQEAIIVAFRRRTLLPLDDCLYAYKRGSQVSRAEVAPEIA